MQLNTGKTVQVKYAGLSNEIGRSEVVLVKLI
jgi:hypothetical protein